jgi:Phage tail repeat like
MPDNSLNLPYLGNAVSQPLNPPFLGDQPAPIATGGNYSAPYALSSASDSAKEDKANKGIANGYAPLDGTTLLPTANLPSHTHTIANVTGLQTAIDGKQASGSYAPATGISPSAITGTAVVTNDSRLTDARTPTAHAHGNITNAGAVGSTANLPLITTTSGAITTGSFGTTANTFCQGNDSRISGIAGGSITTSNAGQINLGSTGGSITSDGYGGSIQTGGFGGSIFTNSYGGTLDLSEHGGSITTGPYGGSINTTGQGSIELGSVLQGPSGAAFGQTILKGSVSGNSPRTITLPNATGTIALTNDSRFTDSRTPTAHTHTIANVTGLEATLIAFAIALG